MYMGDTFIRLGDHDAALKQWQKAVDTMPVTDNRRAGLEKRIADLSTKKS
jgi:predicted negative regulator of RcsB-dependent stress response